MTRDGLQRLGCIKCKAIDSFQSGNSVYATHFINGANKHGNLQRIKKENATQWLPIRVFCPYNSACRKYIDM
jgi:hypothetical protein